MRLSALLLAALAPAALALASNVVDLDSTNFDSFVGGPHGALVEFYAPWCGHCKNLAPVYEQLADAFVGKDVVIAKTDADGPGKDLGKKYGVKGFPTLKYFPPNKADPIDYAAGRDLDTLAAFVSHQTGLKSNIKPPPPSLTTILDATNHDEVALDETKNAIVAYTAPWCGTAASVKIFRRQHCKSLKPVFEKLAATFANEPSVVIAQFDADDARNKGVSGRYGVKSYPTIKFFPKGKKDASFEPTAYDGARTEQAFVDFINEHAGTARKVGGGLSALAGLIPSLDAFTPDFLHAPSHALSDLLAKAQKVLASSAHAASPAGQYYLKVAGRIAEKGADARAWAVKEQARLAKLMQSPSLAPAKVDEVTVKANILSSFLKDRVVPAVEDVEQAVGNAGERAGEALENAKAQAGEAYEGAKEKAGEAYVAAKEKGEQVVQKVKEEL